MYVWKLSKIKCLEFVEYKKHIFPLNKRLLFINFIIIIIIFATVNTEKYTFVIK